MARTRANPNASEQAEPTNQAGRGRGRGRGRVVQDEQVGGRGRGRGGQGEQVVGRGRGRGGRGRGRGVPNAEVNNPPDLVTIINQAVTALMPNLVAQVTAAMGRENVDQVVHVTPPKCGIKGVNNLELS